MKNISLVYFISAFVLVTLCTSCDPFWSEDCSDCLELTTKRIKYIDSIGTNLLFGDQAIYNPDSIEIRSTGGYSANIWQEAGEGTITFDIERDYSIYYIILSDALTDTLEFNLAERESEVCCGNVTYSKKTHLNGQEISNDDLIVINR